MRDPLDSSQKCCNPENEAHIPWDTFSLNKNVATESYFKPGSSWSVVCVVIIDRRGRTIQKKNIYIPRYICVYIMDNIVYLLGFIFLLL